MIPFPPSKYLQANLISSVADWHMKWHQMVSQAKVVKQNNDLTGSDSTWIAKIHQFWDKYIIILWHLSAHSEVRFCKEPFLRQLQVESYLFPKLFVIRMLLTDSLHQKIQIQRYRDTEIASCTGFFYFTFIAWASSFTGSSKMLLYTFQMLSTAGPLLLFNITLLFYILLIHLERPKLWPA